MKTSFGLQLEPQFGYTKKDVDKIAAYVEKSDFDTIWVSDHMFLEHFQETLTVAQGGNLILIC